MRVFVCIYFLLILAGCKESLIKKMIVINKSEMAIDSIKINGPGVQLLYEDIMPNTKIIKTFTMDNKIRNEGAFFYTFYHQDSIWAQGSFGYFVNYYDINSKYELVIHDNLKITAQ